MQTGFQTSVLNATREQVFKVKMYNAATDEFIISQRMATKDGAAIMHGEIMPETMAIIDSSLLERGFRWTAKGFKPE